MRLINFISFYQFFDSLESKIQAEIDSICYYSADKLSSEQLERLRDLRLKLSFLRQIYINLSEFIIDL